MPDRSVRSDNPILGEGIHFLAQRLIKSLGYPISILGVDSLQKCFSSRGARPRIQSANSEHFVGAVEHLLAAGVPNPTARVRQLLCFRQIRLASLQLFLCQLLLEDDSGKVRYPVNDLLVTRSRPA